MNSSIAKTIALLSVIAIFAWHAYCYPVYVVGEYEHRDVFRDGNNPGIWIHDHPNRPEADVPDIQIHKGAVLNFFDGAGLLASQSHKFTCVGTQDAPIEFHFWPDANSNYGGIESVGAFESFPIPTWTTCDTLTYAPSVFIHCRFIGHNVQGIQSLCNFVTMAEVMKVRFDNCEFENGNTGLSCGNIHFPGGQGLVDCDMMNCVFVVENCTFHDVNTAISGSDMRDFTDNCFINGYRRSLGVHILNNRIDLRESGSGITLTNVFLDRPPRTIYYSRLAIEGNVIKGMDGVGIGTGIYFSGNIYQTETDRPKSESGIDHNLIVGSVSPAIVLNISPYPDTRWPSCGSTPVYVFDNIINLNTGNDIAIMATVNTAHHPLIGANVLRTEAGNLAQIGGSYDLWTTNISAALPARYIDRAYHFSVEDTPFLFAGLEADPYQSNADIGVFGGAHSVLKDVYHILPNNWTVTADLSLPTYGYVAEGKVFIHDARLTIGNNSWVAFPVGHSGIYASNDGGLIGSHLSITSIDYVASSAFTEDESGGLIMNIPPPSHQGEGQPYTQHWDGIYTVDNSSREIQLSNCTVADATVGIGAGQSGHIALSGCTIQDCGVGLQTDQGSVLNSVAGGLITHNKVPIYVGGGSVTIKGTDADHAVYVVDNSYGIQVYGPSNNDFENLRVSGSGLSVVPDEHHAGLVLVGGSTILRCCTITDNSGPGMWKFGSAIVNLSIGETNIRTHNDISNNAFSSQIVADGFLEALLLRCGSNRLAGRTLHDLVIQLTHWPASGSALDWKYNYWGGLGDGEVLGHLSIGPYTGLTAVLPADETWSAGCPGGANACQTLTDCQLAFQSARADEIAGNYSSAKTKYQNLLLTYPDCAEALPTPILVPIMEDLGGLQQTSRSFLKNFAGSSPSTPAEKEAYSNAAWVAMKEDKRDSANAEFDSLMLWSTSWADSFQAKTGMRAVDFANALADTSEHRTPIELSIALVDSLQMSDLAIASTAQHLAPYLVHQAPSARTKSDSVFTLSCKAYEQDSASSGYKDSISVVRVQYRLWPNGSWITDTLDGSRSDSNYSISFSLPNKGGGIEYQLMTRDSRGRTASYPDGNYFWSSPDSNKSHFVSFEPRVTTLVSDTAYVYAPGRITHDIAVVKGGLLSVRPSPVAETHTVSIDSGKGITLTNTGSGTRPKLLLQGTDAAPVTLTALDTAKHWAGIDNEGGFIELHHAILKHVSSPLHCDLSSNIPVARIDSTLIDHFDQPVFIKWTSLTSSDSSFITHTNILHGSDAGLSVRKGTLGLDHLVIENCEREGLRLGLNSDMLSICNSVITNNGTHGVDWEDGANGSLRLNNCQISFNGDTLAEIFVPQGCFADLGNDAQNVLKDSSGVLLEAYDQSCYNAEFGQNSFMLLDSATGGKYMKRSGNGDRSYITGNYFSPVGLNSSQFVSTHMTPDTLNRWISTDLHVSSTMPQTVANPSDSIQFKSLAYQQNLLGAYLADSIREVGFKYKLLPDSANWTTRRITHVNADSVYSWWVKAGHRGGLVNYVFWAKDGHGRFVTSPFGADTTHPDSGATNFLTFELRDSTISTDSVVIYAPTTLTHSITIDCGGKLVIKPWPGAGDHTVTLAEGVIINIESYPWCSHRQGLYIEGTADDPIRLTSNTDSTVWDQIWVYWGTLKASYTTFEGSTYALQTQNSTPIIRLDHCTFDRATSEMWVEGTDADSSYFRDCTFHNLGLDPWMSGSAIVEGGDIEISNCWFYGNHGYGLWLSGAYDTRITGSHFVSNDLSGLYTDGYASSVEFSCSEASYNGGDSTAEVIVDGGAFDFSNGAGCTFADHAGTLLEGSSMSNFELDGGENGFFLYDSTGSYISTGDMTDTLNISGNYWYPFTPDSSAFWSHLNPTNSRYWRSDSTADSVLACEGVGTFSLPGSGSSLAHFGDDVSPTMSIPNRPATKWAIKGGGRAAHASKMVSSIPPDPVLKSAESMQKSREYSSAVNQYETFIRTHPQDPRVPAALCRHFVCAKKSGNTNALSAFYASFDRVSKNSPSQIQKVAHGLYLESLALEGHPQQALSGYEQIIRSGKSKADSVQAIISAMSIHFKYGMDHKLSTSYPEYRVSGFRDFAKRAMALTAWLHRRQPSANVEHHPVIPTKYTLYQNYPNPFNPNTEIRFDLPEAVRVELKVFNILGQQVANLVDEVRPAGAYNVIWDSKTTSGTSVASGVYIYQLKAGKFVDSKKMMLIR